MLNPNATNSEVVTRASLQPMGFMDILDTVFSIYRNHFRLIFGICTVYFILRLGVDLSTGISTFFFKSSGLRGMAIAINPVATWIITLISLFSLGALLFTGAQIYLGRHITAGAAFGQVTRRFWSYLGSSLLLMITIAMLAIAIIGIPFAILKLLLGSSLLLQVAITIIGIPFVIYLGVRWGFYAQAVLIEETSATNALKRSRELVRGVWWRVFGIMLAIFLLSFMIETVLQFFLLFAFGFTEVISAGDGLLEMFRRVVTPELTAWDGLAAYIIHILVNNVVASLILPLTPIGITLLYFDQRIRKEGFDVEMDVTNGGDSASGSIDMLPRGDERNY